MMNDDHHSDTSSAVEDIQVNQKYSLSQEDEQEFKQDITTYYLSTSAADDCVMKIAERSMTRPENERRDIVDRVHLMAKQIFTDVDAQQREGENTDGMSKTQVEHNRKERIASRLRAFKRTLNQILVTGQQVRLDSL